jgi:FtsP/CotA-like multicopper oxidase with cupredoxin domain
MNRLDLTKLNRRDLIKLSMMSGMATLIGAGRAWGQVEPPPGVFPCLAEPPQPHPIEPGFGIGVGGEAFPTSPLILDPFTQDLPVPTAMAPVANPAAMTVRRKNGVTGNFISAPGPGPGDQDSWGDRANGPGVPNAGTHQLWPGGSGVSFAGLTATEQAGIRALPATPIVYHLKLKVGQHSFTSSKVLPIDAGGNPIVGPGGQAGPTNLPDSTIYGFSQRDDSSGEYKARFPGALINAEYGKPVLVRFENELDLNPHSLSRNDFGAPDWAFLTHLHNGHTAPESDGQPNHMSLNDGGYIPADWSDNLYLMYPAGNDENEKQSFLWFHDHRMHHTGANVYKGMVGLMPHYDPVADPGDETATVYPQFAKTNLRLPGRRTNNPDGTFNVKYDIPMALYDCALDDGITQHQDWHNGCGETHPEWWGQTFFRHYPNHGFVGDVFTVNCVAYPVLRVFRRKYRLRFLGASIARIYDLWLMSSSTPPVAAPGAQGQYQLPNGQQCMRLNQIASEGGLLPSPQIQDHFEIWPAKRREFVVDFTKYMDGSPTTPGDVIYLVDTMLMPTGRKPVFPGDADFNAPQAGGVTAATYKVPLMKIEIMGAPPEPDLSVNPVKNAKLRPMPIIPNNTRLATLPHRVFELQRSGALGGETEWLINGLQFDPLNSLANVTRGVPEVWNTNNGGGGWVHPMHMHMEEHNVLSRTAVRAKHLPGGTDAPHAGKEDVAALDPAEQVQFYRNFRTFRGKYVAHCHNLAHEDHNMMFGWQIL